MKHWAHAIGVFVLAASAAADGTPDVGLPPGDPPMRVGRYALDDIRVRDACVLAEREAKTYTMIFASGHRGPNRRPAVVAFTSPDLVTWTGPQVIFEIPADFWAQRGIWAPELHAYQGKYYLFLTFDTRD